MAVHNLGSALPVRTFDVAKGFYSEAVAELVRRTGAARLHHEALWRRRASQVGAACSGHALGGRSCRRLVACCKESMHA